MVWCSKIGPKTKKLQKTIIFDTFFVNSEVFQTFLVLGPILAHQTTKFELSGRFRFSRHPWDPWGRINSGVTQELAKSVTVPGGVQVSDEKNIFDFSLCVIPTDKQEHAAQLFGSLEYNI